MTGQRDTWRHRAADWLGTALDWFGVLLFVVACAMTITVFVATFVGMLWSF